MKFILALLMIAGLAACRDNAVVGPRPVHYGEDVCSRCGMIISDRRFAAQYVPHGGEVRKFDDIGCMIEELNEKSAAGSGELEAYVTDYATGDWIGAGKAFYLENGALATPMGYGIAAFGSVESMRGSPYFEKGRALGGFRDLWK